MALVILQSKSTWMALVLAGSCAVACGACGSGGGAASGDGAGTFTRAVEAGTSAANDDGGPIALSAGDGASPAALGVASVTSITVSPAATAIESVDGAHVKQALTVSANYSDGSSGPIVSGLSFTAGLPQVGSFDGAGVFTASGSVGGVVPVSVKYGPLAAAATLTVKVHVHAGTSSVSGATSTALAGATAKDPTVVWAYPYDGTVFPRGLTAPILQWTGGGASDSVYVHVTSPTFELESYAPAPNATFMFDPAVWQRLVDSTSGAANVKVARAGGASATVIADHGWTIAPASMRGTIYYWSNNLGRVLRIKPGAAQPDDFANHAPLNDPAKYAQSSCLMTCHTVSADGSTLVSGGGVFGGTYDLVHDKPTYSLGGTWGGANGNSPTVVEWSNAALSPDGKYLLANGMGDALSITAGGAGGFLGLYTSADGKPVPGSGLMGVNVTQPAWSPEGSRIAFVDSGDPAAWSASWNSPPPGDLKVYSFDESKSPMASGLKTVVATGSDASKRIAWPTISPDGEWVLYSRAAAADTRAGSGDLYIASTVTPNASANQETRLAKLDGDGYPFAAGARDLGWNFEPSFAPVSAGGYFWVVFTSRRTYGTTLTGDKTVVKQLWVAAIDQNPKPGTDPSHPAFHLSGQDEKNLAMRGFWALDPCKGDGLGCSSGTECCGGYCDSSGDAGAPMCVSQAPACATNGDKCAATADCCGAAEGTTCINHVCSEPAPK